MKEKKFPRTIVIISLILIGVSLVGVVFAFLLKANVVSEEIANYIIQPNFVWKDMFLPIMVRNVLLQTGFVLLFIFLLFLYRLKILFVFIVICLTIFGQFYYFQKYVVLGNKEFLYPSNQIFSFLRENTFDASRFVALGQPIVGNFSTLEKVYSPDGLDPIFSNQYGQLVYAAKHEGEFTYNIPRIEVSLSDIDNNTSFSNDSPYIKVINLLGIKYVLYYHAKGEKQALDTKFSSDMFSHIAKFGNWHIYENKMAFKRAYIVYDYKVVKNQEQLIKIMLNLKTDLRKTVFLEENPGRNLSAGSGSASLSYYSSNKVIIKTTSSAEALLFLSDTYYPGWEVYIDSVPSKIFRADIAFRGVFIPSGNHVVTFIYNPASFRYGYMLTLASFIVLAMFALILLRRRKRYS
ncbi:MAG: YfhO family protein [Candidatus Levybacteria bacterium]|nr:YfhO family protein [Candidatus Levybacteria bacterium]